MKNNWYQQLRKQLTLRFLLLTLIVSAVLLLFIAMIGSKAGLEASKGTLSNGDFYYYYLQHSWEINTLLFTIGFIALLLFFIVSFFHSMDALLLCLQGKPLRKQPLFFKMFPQFLEAQKKVESLLAKRSVSEEVSAQKKEHKNELLMYLAHDLKTPLTSMIGYINHILDHHLNEEQEASSLAIAHSKANRLNELIDEFSEVLRYDDKVSQLDVTHIDLTMMLKQQLVGFYPLLEGKGLKLKEEIPQDMLIDGDYDKLQRVFDNLMRNAINYAKPDTTIYITVTKQEQGIQLLYRNKAEDMKEQAVAHLFDKFYRAQSARSSSSGGAGLGLAIAREIMQLHHGDIHAELDGDEISFYLHLPYTLGASI